MLNNPHLNATALATPVNIKGVISARVVMEFLVVPKLPFQIVPIKSPSAEKYLVIGYPFAHITKNTDTKNDITIANNGKSKELIICFPLLFITTNSFLYIT
ncbi:hypothetical protein SDC9_166149 [bioreactor metagenome]|uniref:Uncharacterized protein n=1 Tax=bioreactor metagenome TaxID=1076179 RepID=A0A645FY21_9ZZZZ